MRGRESIIFISFCSELYIFFTMCHSNLIIKDISKSSGGGRSTPELPSIQAC